MKHYLYTVISVVGLFISSSAYAKQVQPVRQLQQYKLLATINAALDVVYSDAYAALSREEKQAEVREVLEASYDLDVIIRRAIGRNWELMSESEQGQVLELIKQLVLEAYVRGMKGKHRPEVTLSETTNLSDKRMEIPSTFVLDNQTYYVTYRLGRMESGWQIYDIVAENISVVANYRQQIDDHFRRGNAAELITRLKQLLKKDAINEETQN